jgi:hypothetical protein
VGEFDAQQRARRRLAYQRAADTHRLAADLENRAVAHFERWGDTDSAELHRVVAVRHLVLARADDDRAGQWGRGPAMT